MVAEKRGLSNLFSDFHDLLYKKNVNALLTARRKRGRRGGGQEGDLLQIEANSEKVRNSRKLQTS